MEQQTEVSLALFYGHACYSAGLVIDIVHSHALARLKARPSYI